MPASHWLSFPYGNFSPGFFELTFNSPFTRADSSIIALCVENAGCQTRMELDFHATLWDSECMLQCMHFLLHVWCLLLLLQCVWLRAYTLVKISELIAEMKSRMRSLSHQAVRILFLFILCKISHFFVIQQRSALPEAAHLSTNAPALPLRCFVELKWMIQWSAIIPPDKLWTFFSSWN